MSIGREVAGVILAAGGGRRMGPFSTRYPKPLLPVCNKTLLERQIEEMARVGIREVFIVVGHLGRQVRGALGDGSRLGVKARYVEQRRRLGIAHAVGQLRGLVKSPLLLFLGDIFFETGRLESMFAKMRRHRAAAVLAVREDEPEAVAMNFTVDLDSRGMVRRVIEKPKVSRRRLKGCGVYLFDLPIFEAIERTPRSALRGEYELTDSIQILIDQGFDVAASREAVAEDMNLSYPQDLLRCNLRQLAKMRSENLVGRSASIHPGADIRNCVIGESVELSGPVRVCNSLMLDHSRIGGRRFLKEVIVTPEGVITCHGPQAGGPRDARSAGRRPETQREGPGLVPKPHPIMIQEQTRE